MQSIRRILVAIKDPRARSQPALAKAMQLARGAGAAVELFHAIDSPVFVGVPSGGEDLQQVERKMLGRSVAQLRRLAARFAVAGVDVDTSAVWDFPGYEAIIRRAQRIGADLIVAQIHPGRHFAPRLLRLNDWELVRQSPLPVLIVKDASPYGRGAVLAAVDPAHAFAKPAALDTGILRSARSIGTALRAPLHVVHAWLPSPAGMGPGEGLRSRNLAERIEAAAGKRAGRDLERLLRGSRIPRSRRHLVESHAWDAIPATARKTGASIVVLGAISRSGLKGLFIGNTAELVLDRLPCDLLVVKPQRFSARVPRRERGMRLSVAPTWA